MPWWPRQTPSSGASHRSTTSRQIPTSADRSGVPGPGEITTASNSANRPIRHPGSSFGTTTGSRPVAAVIWWARLWVNES